MGRSRSESFANEPGNLSSLLVDTGHVNRARSSVHAGFIMLLECGEFDRSQRRGLLRASLFTIRFLLFGGKFGKKNATAAALADQPASGPDKPGRHTCAADTGVLSGGARIPDPTASTGRRLASPEELRSVQGFWPGRREELFSCQRVVRRGHWASRFCVLETQKEPEGGMRRSGSTISSMTDL